MLILMSLIVLKLPRIVLFLILGEIGRHAAMVTSHAALLVASLAGVTWRCAVSVTFRCVSAMWRVT